MEGGVESPCRRSRMKTLGTYQINERTGHGGMGAVYRVHDPVIGHDGAARINREQILNVPRRRSGIERNQIAWTVVDVESVN